jgi:hypothetical protein
VCGTLETVWELGCFVSAGRIDLLLIKKRGVIELLSKILGFTQIGPAQIGPGLVSIKTTERVETERVETL